MANPTLHLSGETSADEFLAKSPLALVVAMVLDQQVPFERAFKAPYLLSERLGGPFDAATIASTPPHLLEEIFSRKPALHRFPKSMADRVRQLCERLIEDYDGSPAHIWNSTDDAHELIARLEALPGFGEQKARIFAALLAKQLRVRPKGWEAATEPYGAQGTYISVADINDADSLARVRAYKRAVKSGAVKSGTVKSGTVKSGSGK